MNSLLLVLMKFYHVNDDLIVTLMIVSYIVQYVVQYIVQYVVQYVVQYNTILYIQYSR